MTNTGPMPAPKTGPSYDEDTDCLTWLDELGDHVSRLVYAGLYTLHEPKTGRTIGFQVFDVKAMMDEACPDA